MRHQTQSRLALLGLVTLCLGGGFLLVAVVGDLALHGAGRALENLTSWRRTLNLVGAVVSLGVWLIARRGHRTAGQLLMIDGVGTIAAVVPYTLMAVLGQTGMAGVFLTALSAMLILLTRALMIPSDARRTLYIGLVSSLLAAFLSLGVHVSDPLRRGQESLPDVTQNLVMWLIVVVAISTVASWVLFGLRREMRAARRLGQYILMEPIGHGGMGMVYRARHTLLRRPTALKLLPPEATSGTAVERFEREVQLTASLQHPNTITVFDYGRTADGVFYYVMEYLDGGDLESVVRTGGPMPAARVLYLLKQIVGGLAEAHEIGLIHRDVKPANLLLASAPQVADLAKIVDFGLVRERQAEEESAITQTGTVMGTPLYLSPEAISTPDKVDARADIYALGAVGYFLLTGETVFQGGSVVEICSHHLHTEPIPPSQRLGERVPETLEEILLRCLAKSPDARPQSALELAELLDACEDVGDWSRADARRWWAEHGEALRTTRDAAAVSATSATVAVDIGRR